MTINGKTRAYRMSFYNIEKSDIDTTQINIKYYLDEDCQNEVRPVNVGLYYIEITTPETDDYLETTTINNPPDNCPIGLKINKVATTTTLEDESFAHKDVDKLKNTPQKIENTTMIPCIFSLKNVIGSKDKGSSPVIFKIVNKLLFC